jgi:hypothetical protein
MEINLPAYETALKRRLHYQLKKLGFLKQADGCLSPPEATKEAVRRIHQAQREKKLRVERDFVCKRWTELKQYFASGKDVIPSSITPDLELIEASTWQSDLFRLASLTWSVPVSQGQERKSSISGIECQRGITFTLRVLQQTSITQDIGQCEMCQTAFWSAFH